MTRHNGRAPRKLRPIKITRHYTKNPAGSVLIQTGETRVLCTACFEEGVPKWREKSGLGWVTAEYDMLPGNYLDGMGQSARHTGLSTLRSGAGQSP